MPINSFLCCHKTCQAAFVSCQAPGSLGGAGACFDLALVDLALPGFLRVFLAIMLIIRRIVARRQACVPMLRRRFIRSSIGGWVLNKPVRLPFLSGLAKNRWAVAVF